MKTLSRWILALLLGLNTVAVGPNAKPVYKAATPARTLVDDSIALLPKSDVVAILDINRLMNDLLPKARTAWPEPVAKLEKELNEITSDAAKSGVDLLKVKTLTIGLKLFGNDTSGAMIVDGITLQPESMKDSTATTYKGKTVYIEKSAPEPKASSKSSLKGSAAPKTRPAARKPASGKSSDGPGGVPLGNVSDVASSVGANLLKGTTAFVQLDAARVAIGDEVEVKAVIDAATGSPTPATNVSADLSAALQETTSTGLLRFAVTIPDDARKAAQGEEFLKNLALTKMVLGTLDVGDDMGLLLDAKLRTGSANDATKLHESLAALMGLGKMMLGGNQDPMMVMLNKLLDQIRITPQANDVTLAVSVPRELYEMFLKSESKAAPAKNDK